VVKKAIDDFSAVVDHQLLEEDLDPGLLAMVIQAGPKSRKIAEDHESLVQYDALVLGILLERLQRFELAELDLLVVGLEAPCRYSVTTSIAGPSS
jgi:hypothetical protein